MGVWTPQKFGSCSDSLAVRGWHGKIFCTHPHPIPTNTVPIPAWLSAFCYNFCLPTHFFWLCIFFLHLVFCMLFLLVTIVLQLHTVHVCSPIFLLSDECRYRKTSLPLPRYYRFPHYRVILCLLWCNLCVLWIKVIIWIFQGNVGKGHTDREGYESDWNWKSMERRWRGKKKVQEKKRGGNGRTPPLVILKQAYAYVRMWVSLAVKLFWLYVGGNHLLTCDCEFGAIFCVVIPTLYSITMCWHSDNILLLYRTLASVLLTCVNM